MSTEVVQPENCPKCHRLFQPEGAEKLSQWRTFCRCFRKYSPNSQYSIDICANCKKRTVVNSKGKVNHPDLCSCDNPNPKSIPAHLKQGEKEEPVTLDLALLEMSPDDFPSERFQPIGILGKSAFANTVLCRDKQTGSKVAVKCLKSITPEIKASFEQEGKILSRLNHPKIAKLLLSGIHNNKTPYLVSEYKDGYNLEQYLAIHDIPSFDVAVMILISLCEVSVYLQKERLFIENIKPENIIFVDDLNSEPAVFITDISFPNLELKDRLSDIKDVHYMSSEVARNMDYSDHAEMYSIGCIGFALLTGRPPFEHASPQKIKNNHALVLPPRISNLKTEKGRPGDLEEVVERCLEKDPRVRFESVSKLLERLEVFPRREQNRIALLEAEKGKQQSMRVLIIVLVVVVLGAIGYFVIPR